MSIIATAQRTITDTNDPIISGTEPENPFVGMLWLDTSPNDRDIQKRYSGDGKWVEVSITQEEIETIEKNTASIETLEGEIKTNVSKSTVQGMINESQKTIESNVTQKANEMNVKFNECTSSISGLNNDVKKVTTNIETYFQFNADGLTIGKSNDNFKTVLRNDRLSFQQDGSEVAYISNNKLYITQAEIIERLTIGAVKGENEKGWYDWVANSEGLGQIWKTKV